MMPYFRNIVSGVRLATFMRCERKDFVVSWGALVAALLTSIALQFVIEVGVFFYREADFNRYSWYEYHAMSFCLIILSSFCIALLFNQTEKILSVAVIFYYSFIAFLAPYFLLFAEYPSWMNEKAYYAIHNLIMIWSFLVMFRIVGINFPSITGKQVAAALLAPLCIFVLNQHVYLSHMFYPEDVEEEVVEQSAFEKLSEEEIFRLQAGLLDREFENLKGSKKGVVDVYGISLGSFAYQDVFMKEARYVAQRFEDVLKMKGRVVTLINNEETFFETPMATATNLEDTLKRIAKRMQPKEDILLLYMTSHGDQSGLSVILRGGLGLKILSGELVAEALKQSGIKNKVIIISACHSGSLIDALSDDDTMIMTAAADNKQSYGCSDDADLTFFAEGYFTHGLEKTTNLEEAFAIAKKRIEDREGSETLGPPSDPQIFIGKNIMKTLAKYKPVSLAK